ncbi:hypothetical protein P3342_012268 [Pyrenophora teres f. teres]|uniref:Uncharacterized protein n=2 Tax=Pyrenophora teres f. teres TaxID=97479 RepID=E3RV89_PYRTT|nr:hypothetical protein PTT_13076 [Pyrenophora teres f. teres 0-1]KAE8824046.1 hypothetical protein HRS9139_09228 [Pyrenophora teres f. teres]CAA9966076.1 hypothetical protein PTMSG1_09435 [Pyrenophora teres f. maculata]KAE8827251.1 hypothetical protein PTNB85_08604 [Pyrenophora teres f. teres]KAE8831453.1 hypothetical protein HRS9122_09043 [Pyrenophora teres f. teres]
MAGPLLNLSIFKKSTNHTLRAISLALFPPAFILLFIQGVSSGDVNPAIGIIPLFFSAAYSALLLANEKRCGCQASGLTGTPVHLVFDVLLGAALLVCLILDWVNMTISSDCDDSMIMLGTYGTNFLICNFLIHVYFVVNQLLDALQPGPAYPASCPQCQNGSFTVGNIKIGTRFQDYAPLLDRAGEPRNIEEEPTADDGGSMV